MKNTLADVLCNQAHDADGREFVPPNRYGHRLSLDSSRSTRGGSEVPNLGICYVKEKENPPVSDGKGVILIVGTKFKAAFGKGNQNKGVETEKDASSDSSSHLFYFWKIWHAQNDA